MKKINQKTVLADLLDDSRMEQVLVHHKIPCLACPFAKSEMEHLTIGDICKMYGLNAKKIINDLNRVNEN